LSDHVRRIAALAELSAEQATDLNAVTNDWLKKLNLTEEQFKTIEQLAAAKRGKIDYAELFGLTKDEAKSFLDFYTLTNGAFYMAGGLLERNQLTPNEAAAVKKIVAYLRETDELLKTTQQHLSKVFKDWPKKDGKLSGERSAEALNQVAVEVESLKLFLLNCLNLGT
jgi:hypothetical protein